MYEKLAKMDTSNIINFIKLCKIIDLDMSVNILKEKNKFPALFWPSYSILHMASDTRLMASDVRQFNCSMTP